MHTTRVSMIPNALQDRHSIHTQRYLLYSSTAISRIVYFFFVNILSSGSANYICYKRRSGVKEQQHIRGRLDQRKETIYTHTQLTIESIRNTQVLIRWRERKV
jgi:hypothetical protein